MAPYLFAAAQWGKRRSHKKGLTMSSEGLCFIFYDLAPQPRLMVHSLSLSGMKPSHSQRYLLVFSTALVFAISISVKVFVSFRFEMVVVTSSFLLVSRENLVYYLPSQQLQGISIHSNGQGASSLAQATLARL